MGGGREGREEEGNISSHCFLGRVCSCTKAPDSARSLAGGVIKTQQSVVVLGKARSAQNICTPSFASIPVHQDLRRRNGRRDREHTQSTVSKALAGVGFDLAHIKMSVKIPIDEPLTKSTGAESKRRQTWQRCHTLGPSHPSPTSP